MPVLYHNPLFEHLKEYLEQSKSSDTIFFFVSYIKTGILERLIDGISSRMIPDGNYEVGIFVENFTNQDKLFFERIRNEARLVDDAMYEAFKF